MKVTIRPKYEYLSDFIEKIPSIFDTGELIYDGRNKLRIFHVGDLTLNVKSYKVPIFINRIIYSIFRPTKAQRAYEYALKLLSLGVETPAPIAYIEEKKCGLLSHSYFISLHTPLQGNIRLFGSSKVPFEEHRELAIAFARYTAELHEKQILHIDYSPGNILYEKKADGTYLFSLIDINRMKFCKVDQVTGCKNFSRIWARDEFYQTVAKEYAEARGFDVEECTKMMIAFRDKERKKRDRKKMLKQKLKK